MYNIKWSCQQYWNMPYTIFKTVLQLKPLQPCCYPWPAPHTPGSSLKVRSSASSSILSLSEELVHKRRSSSPKPFSSLKICEDHCWWLSLPEDEAKNRFLPCDSDCALSATSKGLKEKGRNNSILSRSLIVDPCRFSAKHVWSGMKKRIWHGYY